jgi:hypothetical protein
MHEKLSHHRFSVGDTVRILDIEKIQQTLGEDSMLDGCLMTEQMYLHCGQLHTIVKVVDNIFLEQDNRMYRTKASLYALDKLYCNGICNESSNRCDKSCYLFWHENWLSSDELNNKSFKQVNNKNGDKDFVSNTGNNQYTVSGKQLRTDWDPNNKNCQLKHIRKTTIKNSIFNCIYQYIVHSITNIKKYIVCFYRSFKNNKATRPQSTYSDESVIYPGDIVKVKSKKEISSMLDSNRKYMGCFFMNEMYDCCEREYKVHNKIDFFFDETKNKMCKCSNIFLLEDSTCSGKRKLYMQKCNRGCYFFWNKDWLVKAGKH